ncbi:MAG: DUF4062 domain-containing protein [Candidatus Omnitrophota bacterium]
MNSQKKIVFISSKQDELQAERIALRNFINQEDKLLPKLFIAKIFEHDLSGRKESVTQITEDWVLKSDVYLGIFDRKHSEPTLKEYKTAVNDKIVKKEIIVFIRSRPDAERDTELNNTLSQIMDIKLGHSCIIYDGLEDLLLKAKNALLKYKGRCVEGFIISEEVLGKNLDKARHTNFPEKLRRKLLQPLGRFMVPKGRKGIYECYVYDENGTKIDVTWSSVKDEPNVSLEIKEFYKQRYQKPFDSI